MGRRMIGRLRAIAAFGIVSLALGVGTADTYAATSPDPGTVVRPLVDDLDLQTQMPGDPQDPSRRKDETPSDANLKIPGATTVLWVAVGVALLLVLYALKDYVPGFSRRVKTRADVAAEATQGVQAAERMAQAGDEADELAASGRVAEAMHLLLLRSLVELRRRLGISFADSLTSREILARLTLPEDGRQALGDLIRRVEFAHFGAKPADEADYAACRESYERLIAAMLDPRDAGRPMAAAA